MYDITARRGGNGTINGTSDFQDNLASRMTRLACFMRLCCAIERKCQAYCRSKLSLVGQLAEESEILPTRRTRIPFARFALPKIAATDWTPLQKKRLGVGSVVT